MPRADVPLREVLVADSGPDQSIEVAAPAPRAVPAAAGASPAALPASAPPLGHDVFSAGDRLLVFSFALVGAVCLCLSLWPGAEAVLAAECSPNATCTYTEGLAFYHADSVASTWDHGRAAGGIKACCHGPATSTRLASRPRSRTPPPPPAC